VARALFIASLAAKFSLELMASVKWCAAAHRAMRPLARA
jgi:hypothetical protein